MAKVNVGIIQMSCVKEKDINLQKAIQKIKEAATKGARIICLQELFTSLYFCDVEDYENFLLAEPRARTCYRNITGRCTRIQYCNHRFSF
ncbi:MAG: nitrilase-related carbon-nitrogen hydrolase [Puia sp.]